MKDLEKVIYDKLVRRGDNYDIELEESLIEDVLDVTYTEIIPAMIALNYMPAEIGDFTINLIKRHRNVDDKRKFTWLEILTVLKIAGVKPKNALKLYNKLKKKR